jgi:hypothetical protein
MYTNPNFKSKKALREAIARGETVRVFSPGPFPATADGRESVEGPHYPAPHSWYAAVEVKAGVVIKVYK